MREQRNKAGQRWAVGGLLLVLALLGGGGLWLRSGEDRLPAKAAVTPPMEAQGPASPVSVAPAPAEVGSSEAVSASRTGARPAHWKKQLAQLEAQWCTHALQAHQQSIASIKQGHGSDKDDASEEALSGAAKAQAKLPTTLAKYQVRDRLLSAWAEQLRRQADARSLATAAHLVFELKRSWEPDWASTLAWMQAEAQRTTDPYVLHVWALDASDCQRQGACASTPAGRWADIEPANLMAWLHALPKGATPTPAQWRGMAQAQYARTYGSELQSRLLALAADTPSGLELQVALEFIESQSRSFKPEVLMLSRICASPDALRERQAVCLRAADLVWRQEQATVNDRILASALASKVGGDQEAAWAARHAALKAMDREALAQLMLADYRGVDITDCAQLPALRAHLNGIAKVGVWRATLSDRAPAALR